MLKPCESERTTAKKRGLELQGIETDIYTWEGKARPLYDYKKKLDIDENLLKKKSRITEQGSES